MKKKNHGHVNHERYLVTYADLITLLLAFFIILYAMSTPDAQKMQQMANALSMAFHPQASSIMPPLASDKETSVRKHREQLTDNEKKTMAAISEQNSLRKIQKQIDKEIESKDLNGKVKTNLTDAGLKIILTNEILFDSASANLNNSTSIKLLDEIGIILSTIDNPVSIEGHTDNIPINNSQYPSNWDLSAARSLSVLREMVSGTPKIDPKRFSTSGYGEFQPIADNNTLAGQQTNRRVEIVIKRQNSDGLLQTKRGGANN
ncbi:flagellar motor protein MotB [Bacillus cereus]|uniref:flagellar motor protein MotB n=1 Tax=Bacillus cereus TaxID=1396 RepID=UPI000B4AF10A|nr:flagellar motor protein MotB [Bacillus cereus]